MLNLVEIPASAAKPSGGGSRLEAVLHAESRAETWSRRRTLCGRLVIALSLPMASFLYRGQGIADASARFVLVLWALTLACSIVCASVAFRSEHVLEVLLTTAGGRYLRNDEPDEEQRASS